MMLNKKSKKAVEAIVGTVLLLLITVALAGIIFGVIVPFIQNKLMEGEISACMNVRVVVDTKQGYTCYDEVNNAVDVMISRGADDVKLYGLQIIVAIDGTTKAFEFNQSLPERNEQRTFTINLDLSSGATPKEVGVAPIVKIGNMQQLCGVTSAAKLGKCS